METAAAGFYHPEVLRECKSGTQGNFARILAAQDRTDYSAYTRAEKKGMGAAQQVCCTAGLVCGLIR